MILENKKKVLIVDDDQTNITLMTDFLEEEDYLPLTAQDGEIGLAVLETNPDITAVILDWMMPKMNGIDMLKKIKQTEKLSGIPIIMNTGKNDRESIVEGINAGAYYYLTKPFDLHVMSTILKKAIKEYENHKIISNQIKTQNKNIIAYLNSGKILFKTPDEALYISSWISEFTHSEKISIGLSELLINAIEHGNLGIGYEKKEEYLMNDTLELEIKKRLEENRDKYVSLFFEKLENRLKITIEDMGRGFDYNRYLTIEPERVFDLHGRGVAMANMSFCNGVLYKGKGNKVEVNIPLNEPDTSF